MLSTIEYSDSEPEIEEEEEEEEEPEELEEEEEEPEEEPEEEEPEEDPEVEQQVQSHEEQNGQVSALDSHSTPKNNDSSQEVEPERDNEDLRFENPKESLAGVRSASDDHCDSVNPTNEPLDTQVGVIPRVGEEDTEPQNLSSDVVSSEDNEFQESLSDNKLIRFQLENCIVIDSCTDVQREYNKECGNQNLSNNIICTDDGKNKSIPVDEKKIVAESLMGDNSANKVSNNNLLFKEEIKQMDLLPGEDIKAKTSRSITRQIRLRSLSPGATFEVGNKRPAVLCELFAGGWCIKGNSCKFLHHKDGVTSTSKCDKQDVPTARSKDNLEENEGLRVENRKSSVLSEPLISSDANDQSLIPSISSETIRVEVYGENQRPHQFRDNQGMHMSPVSNIAASEWKSSAAEENIRYSGSGISLRHDNHNHSPNLVGHTISDTEEFVRGYSSSMSRLVPEHRLNESLTQSTLYGNINSLASGKCGSHTAPQFFYSLNRGFDTSLRYNSLHQTHKWSGTALSRSPSLDGDHWYSSSRSLLLTHSSAPYYSRLDTENLSLHDVSGSISTRLRAQPNISNWEPSIPFRPSFNFSSFISSPRNQYDPLLDSVDSPNLSGKIFKEFSVIQGEIVRNSQQANAGYVSFHQQPQYGLNKSMSTKGIGASRTSADTARIFVAEQLNKSAVFKKENPLKPGHTGNTSNAMEVDHYLSLSQADRSEYNESKVLKHFRATLVEFVKELLRPHWREGNLSKDAHNTVVRKAVEKVLSALQPYQIPNTVESITQYISSSRPKLTKLVEGYVGKYAKS